MYREGICPSCKEKIQIPEGHDKLICMFCGKEFLVNAALELAMQEEKIAPANETVPENKAESSNAPAPVSGEVPAAESRMQTTDAQAQTANTVYGDWKVIYDDIREKYVGLLDEVANPMKGFRKQEYENNFKAFYKAHKFIVEELDKAYCSCPDKQMFLKMAADDFAANASVTINTIEKKAKRQDKQFGYNMTMVIYIFPTLNEYNGFGSKELAQAMADSWNETFDNTHIQVSTYEMMLGGFKRKWCFITTAVCETLGREDNCMELSVLRNYRDNILSSTDEGRRVVEEYYDIAPTIVKHIRERENSEAIFAGIYEDYLKTCVECACRQEYDTCRSLYTNMVMDLKNLYFIDRQDN